MTTSTAMLKLALLGPEYVAGLPGEGNQWARIERHLRQQVVETGLTYSAQGHAEVAAVKATLDVDQYVRAVSRNTDRLFFDSEVMLAKFARRSAPGLALPSRGIQPERFHGLAAFNYWGWRLVFWSAATLFLLPSSLQKDALFLSTSYKAAAAVFAIQVFVIFVHGRYYVQFVPLIAAAMACVAFRPSAIIDIARPRSLDEWIVGLGQLTAAIGGLTLIAIYARGH